MKKKLLLFIMLFLIPILVLADNGEDAEFPIGFAMAMEAFVSIHMSLFVLKPLSEIFGKNGNSKKLFWTLFFSRVAILLYFDFFITTSIAIVDFLAVFVGAFILVPICSAITKIPINHKSNQVIKEDEFVDQNQQNLILKCASCGAILNVNNKFCGNCGSAFDGNNVKVEMDPNVPLNKPQSPIVTSKNFDILFSLPEDRMVEEFINRELIKAQIDINTQFITSGALRRKNIFNIIFSMLLCIYIILIFFHFPIITYILGLIILIIFYKTTRKYNLMKYLKKQLKARPNEKISNIVMNAKATLVADSSKKVLRLGTIVAIILPIIMFMKPVILYEKMDNGYGVRFYAFGITNFTTATIPEKYKGEDVISLRGNTFSNMPLLEEVTLPNTITEIRGQAFKNNYKLKSVNIPEKLEYLGGGAFYNCKTLTSIEIPDTVTYIGGESFMNASSLKSVKLSNNITEIRGSTFENCSSLESIEIPDKVTRIGGHAFYGNNSLSRVYISENSSLSEIGSSAFRLCYNLREITIPQNTYVNERAFKESPTIVNRYNHIQFN